MTTASTKATPTTMSTETDTTTMTFKRLLGTDELVLRLRELMPGGISKRTVYAWLDMGCPHVPVPGARKKLGFVFDEVVTWVMSHKVERDIYANPRRVA
jgi:predicted DNA-binding transcriptional regulator AlpA